MKLLDSIEYAIKNLRMRSMRSWLTVLGIVIGVIAMVVITGVTEGVNKSVTDLMSSFGPDKMFVIPVNIENGGGFGSGFSGGPASRPLGKLYERDVDSVKSISGVDATSRMIFGRASLGFKGKELSAALYAADASVFGMFGDYITLEKGRFFDDNDRKVVVLGNDAANKMFGKDKLDVGSVLVVNGENYRVIGVLNLIGSALSTADDSNIYIPFEDGKDLFKQQLAKDEVAFIYIDLSDGFDANEVKDAIDVKIASNHRVTMDEKDFSVITADFINKTVGSILGTLSNLLFAITAVATVVGGIGISNTMFMSVLERKREIGILKSVGASEKDIEMIFLTESAMIGLLGGIIGFVVGVVILYIGSQFGIPYLLRIRWVIFVFVFSIGVGLVAGFIPARNAARLNAVDALRQ